MKKLLLFTLLLVSVVSLGQEFREVGYEEYKQHSVSEPLKPIRGESLKPIRGELSSLMGMGNRGMGVGLSYGFKANAMGIDVLSFREKKALWGGGASFSFNAPERKGIELNDHYGWTTPNYKNTGDVYSMYGICGYSIRNFFAYGKLGIGSKQTIGYYNHYSQWHYKIENSETIGLIGISAGFGAGCFVSHIGYDTFNGINFGILLVM